MQTEITTEGFTIQTPVFNGPFALLLSLVEDKKLFINDISLAQVTEDYLEYVRRIERATPEHVSSFIVIAATLLLIKSKSLLPDLTLTQEEEGDVQNLEGRLKQYKRYSELSIHIKELFGRNIIFNPEPRKNDVLVFLPDERITKESMMEFARDVIAHVPKKQALPEVEVKKVISIEEMIDRLTERVQNSLNTNFRDFTGIRKAKGEVLSKEERVVVIVGFLAMLELARTGILNLIQDNNFDDIMIEKKSQETSEELM